VTYSIGGGGGTFNQIPGNGDTSDGSGVGAEWSVSIATAGRANSGNGGGGGVSPGTYVGKSGGSGIVVLRIPTANYSGVTTGSPAITTSGLNTIITFTGSGSYTA
jgi:hypothetical protein